jgi:DNA ligase (NAD+)
METRARAAWLRREIERHNRLYYLDHRPEISDTEYDRLFRELVDIETADPSLQTPDSPTLRVGAPPAEGFGKHPHGLPMLSLDNAFGEDELRGFDERARRGLGSPGPLDYVVEPKFDGLSMSLTYDDGLLTIATTRGDGETGEVVTANARTVRGIPLRLETPLPGRVEVRGEVLMLKDTFDAVNRARAERGEQLFSNPRNAAAGGIRQLDSRLTAQRKLSFFAYGFGLAPQGALTSHAQSLRLLDEMGFVVDPNVRLCHGIEEVLAHVALVERLRPSLPFGIDGAVVKLDSQ